MVIEQHGHGGALRLEDPEVASLVAEECARQRRTLQLIASENFVSPAVLEVTGSVLTNKYAEGYPGRRYYGGNAVVDRVEEVARHRARRLFGADWANVQPHSGSNANAAALLALAKPGDTILALRLDQGGHLTHGAPVNFSGRLFRFVHYGLTPAGEDGERIDLEAVADLAKRERPAVVIAGATAYPRVIDPEPFAAIAEEVGARFLFDAAHVAGLVAGGVHPSPVPFADVVTFTTHKTLRGPRGGVIVGRAGLGEEIDRSVFPGLQGGPLEHVVAAKAVAFGEALRPEFSGYAAQVVANARALADALGEEGLRLVSGGTDTHLVLVDLRSFDPDLDGRSAQTALERAGIAANRNAIPGDPRPPFVTSGLRLGSAAETTAGMGEEEMGAIGGLIARALRAREDGRVLDALAGEVARLCEKFPPPGAGRG